VVPGCSGGLVGLWAVCRIVWWGYWRSPKGATRSSELSGWQPGWYAVWWRRLGAPVGSRG
jgi:hypothetical protein